jgi:hypothetical protein
MCVQAGLTAAQVPPPFSANRGDIVNDDSVKWMSLGHNPKSFSIPIGGSVGDTLAHSYFSSDRGQVSLQYLINKGRALLLEKARCIDIKWQSQFAWGTALSCRQNATIEAWNIPGGVATGKIKSYSLVGDGATGAFLTNVTIGVAVGLGGIVEATSGESTYIESDFIDTNYYEYAGGTILVGSSNDIGYSRPVANPDDDGLVFPLSGDQITLKEEWVGDLEAQKKALQAVIPYIQRGGYLQMQMGFASENVDAQVGIARQMAQLSAFSVANALIANPIYLDLRLKPVTGTSFANTYVVNTTPLEVYEGINLGAG